MREIKFRAWLDEEKGFDNPCYVKPASLQEMIFSKQSSFSLKQLYDMCTFEQYTGLKDKNGKQIYEGDIVEFTSQYWGMLGNRYEVKFKQGTFCVKYGLLSEISPSISVVGNIHQNADLLEGEK